MSSETSIMAERCHLQEWDAQIRDCQNRPDGMGVVIWCVCYGITKANYYYRLRRVRKACLENVSEETVPQQIVPVASELLYTDERNGSSARAQPGLDISVKGISIHVTESTSIFLLADVLKAVQHAE